MPLQNLKRRFGAVIICLSNENMKNFNFPLKHWCWIKIINTTGCDPLLKLGRCYPIEINNGRVKSTPNNVIFKSTPSSVKFITCLHQLQSQINTGTCQVNTFWHHSGPVSTSVGVALYWSSSAQCKSVVSDILGETEFFTNIENLYLKNHTI